MADVRVLSIIARMNVGGPAAILAATLDGLDPDRFEQHLAFGAPPVGEADWLALHRPDLLEDVRLHSIATLGPALEPRRDLKAFRNLRQLIAQLRPDIVHTHTAKAGLLGRLAAQREHVPHLVHSYHGHVLRGYFSPPITAAITRIERRLARRTDRLLAVGSRVRDELLAARIGRPEQYVVIPPGRGLVTAWTKLEARQALDIPVEAPVLAYVGRLAAVKRPDRLAAAVHSVARRFPDVILLVAGGGSASDEAALREQVHGLNVRFLGWLDDVAQVYSASDLVVLSSDNEGMPVTLIEAAMCGRACVATDVGGVSEVVRHDETGLLVRPAVEALAAGIVELLGDPDRSVRLGQAASDWAQGRFTEEALVRRTAAVYESVLATGPQVEG